MDLTGGSICRVLQGQWNQTGFDNADPVVSLHCARWQQA